jgi:hypothetical protein
LPLHFHESRRTHRVPFVVLGVLVGAFVGRTAQAACNLIPSASQIFRGALGATNEPKQPGMSQIIVKAKRWFSAAAANDPTPANTRLTITVGPAQCYTHVATKKTD